MKRVLNNLLYDTDTATLIGTNACMERLYRKRTGEYFLFANNIIIPLSYEGASTWLNDINPTDRPFSSRDFVRVSVTISNLQHKKLLDYSTKKKVSISSLIRNFIDSLE